MRIYADVNRLPDSGASETTSVILQVAPSPPEGTATPINGKFVVDIPDGVYPPRINAGSRLINLASPGYMTGQIYDGLQRSFPGYQNFIFNQLLTSTDDSRLDPSATFPVDSGPPEHHWKVRYQSGRSGAPPLGMAPGGVALLPENSHTVPSRPGLIITNTLDIGPYTGGLGAKSFIVYWKVYTMDTSHDVMDFGTGENIPAVKNLIEAPQDLLEAFLSVNDGAGYTPVNRLSPCVTCDPGTLIRLAFVNHNPFKVYITAYAVMF